MGKHYCKSFYHSTVTNIIMLTIISSQFLAVQSVKTYFVQAPQISTKVNRGKAFPDQAPASLSVFIPHYLYTHP